MRINHESGIAGKGSAALETSCPHSDDDDPSGDYRLLAGNFRHGYAGVCREAGCPLCHHGNVAAGKGQDFPFASVRNNSMGS